MRTATSAHTEEIAACIGCNKDTVVKVRKRYVEQGLQVALERKKRETGARPRVLDGEGEARLLAIACQKPPSGRANWTLQLLADRLVELEIVRSISHQTVHSTLKKTNLLPHLRECWVIPPDQDANFVAGMEDVLDVYHRPYDPKKPMVCMDEQPMQLVKETRLPIPCTPGQSAKYDYEYERAGTASIFMFCEPLAGKRYVTALPQRTMNDWAHQIKHLLDVVYPNAEKVILVCDNLNTHKPAALYKTFPPDQA